ncbi:hypothetical protein L596_018666 [Steinernema carpocapsae]|uniref:Uncharacterized protein n=1 Tax=Steinernema carpocapsae TaxID=34508 RepID=A0A4U5N627_STECR|nr:hypothetical protein L596_018666 [Steinernema carpocapsae]
MQLQTSSERRPGSGSLGYSACAQLSFRHQAAAEMIDDHTRVTGLRRPPRMAETAPIEGLGRRLRQFAGLGASISDRWR